MSRTKDALDYMAKTKCTAYVAAEKFGISASTIYAAARKKRCPHCGNFVKPKKSKLAEPGPKSGPKPGKPELLEV